MIETTHLWLFSVMVLGVILLPGLDMAYVVASAIAGGRRAGAMAITGIVVGAACHVLLGALGIMAVLTLIPAAFNVLLLAGALYIAWIGSSLLRSRATFNALPALSARSGRATFWQGLATCLLNPKAYLFMLAVFPQFVKPAYGPLWLQAGVMWAIIAICQVGVYGGVAMAGAHLREWLHGRPVANAWLARGVGVLLIGAALLTAWGGIQQWSNAQ